MSAVAVEPALEAIPILDPSELYRPEKKKIEDFRLFSDDLVSRLILVTVFSKHWLFYIYYALTLNQQKNTGFSK